MIFDEMKQKIDRAETIAVLTHEAILVLYLSIEIQSKIL